MTREDFQPRRDGFFEHEANWGEVTVGTIIAQRDSRTKTWEVIGMAHGTGQIPDASTPFIRIRCREDGTELTLQPRHKAATCVVLTNDPLDEETIPGPGPTDTDAVMAIVTGLGGTLLAERDHESGIVTCPDYVHDTHLVDTEPEPIRRGLIDHLRFAHAMPTDDDVDLAELMRRHHDAHDPSHPAFQISGFPHQHLPIEDSRRDWVLRRKVQQIYRMPQEAT